MEEAFRAYPQVLRVHNPDFATTAMFDSIKLGLKKLQTLGEYDALLVMPADMPAIRPETIRRLVRCWENRKPDVLFPVYRKEQGHPPVIHEKNVEALLQDPGTEGLRGAFQRVCLHTETMEVTDPAVLMDADYREDYEALVSYWPKRYYPGLQECEAFYEMAQTPKKVQEHSLAVRKKALELTDALLKQGIKINRNLVESVALLHDIKRTESNHAKAGADFFRELGLFEIADPIEIHMDWPEKRIIRPEVSSVLYLADKLVSGDQSVSLEERFLEKGRMFGDNPEALRNIRRRKETALAIKASLEATGIQMEEGRRVDE